MALLATAAVWLLGRQAEAGTVTSLADSGPGSLREAIANAPPGDTIGFSVTGTITLTSGELLVTKSLTILGPGPGNLAVDGNAASRVFHTTLRASVSLSGLTITNGHAAGQPPADSGGGILNERATLTLSNCTVSGNSAHFGGGILNDGFLTNGISNLAFLRIVNSSLSNNSALAGGGIYNNRAAVEILNSTLMGNSAGASVGSADGGGGAIFSDGAPDGSTSVFILNSALIGNFAGDAVNPCDGGAIYNANTFLTIRNSTLSGNLAHRGNGGSIVNLGSVGNMLQPASAELDIEESTLSGNVADSLGGGILNLSVELGSAHVVIFNSTMSSNYARLYGGGIYNAGGSGDGRFGPSALVDIRCSTLSGNLALSGGGIFNENTVPTGRAEVEIVSTILNTGAFGGNITNSSGTVSSLGYNLSSDDAGGFLTNTTDQINTDPLLGPLQDNGGPTFTHALLCGSPAIDKGRNFASSFFDQRGNAFIRAFDDPTVQNAAGGDGTDIGAFEIQTVCNQPPVAKCRSVTVPAGAGCTASASIDDGSFDPDGNPIALAQSPPGPYPVGTNVVTLTVADSHGASNSCTALVIVQENTPSRITCPADISAEFTTTIGAVVSFAPTASDTCSGPPVVVCAPASGSTFPLGITLVLCAATDLSGNSASCAFQVTVLGAHGVKQNVLAGLKALQGNPTRGKDDDRRALDLAVRFLAASLEARFWVDETHVQPLRGGLAISEEALAVHELEELMCSRHSPAPADILRGFIQRVVKSDRLLAVVSIEEATQGGLNPRRIQKALLAVSRGDAKAAADHYEEAIEQYREAWAEVQRTRQAGEQ